MYCRECGKALIRKPSQGRLRWTCSGCAYIHFDDPKVAVGVLIGDGREILLTLRNHEPQQGRWSFPAGYVDRAEVVEEAAVREVREETGLDVTIEALLGVFSRQGDPVIFIAYAGEIVGGELRPGAEADDAAFFAVDRLPALAFPHDAAIIDTWRRQLLAKT